MSIASYRRNVRKGVTGPCSPTCYPAALEQVSPYNSLPPKAYRDYLEFGKWYDRLDRDGRRNAVEDYEELVGSFAYHLGKIAMEDVVFKRANTAIGLKRIINQLVADEYRIVLEVAMGHEPHAVGLLPLPEPGYFTLVSTHLPKTLQGVVTLDHISKRLYRDNDPYLAGHPIHTSNITALPPAA